MATWPARPQHKSCCQDGKTPKRVASLKVSRDDLDQSAVFSYHLDMLSAICSPATLISLSKLQCFLRLSIPKMA